MNEIEILSLLLMSEEPDGKTMIDVGAHHGDSCALFVQRGWKVYAFEPDPANRVRLIERFESMPNLRIDHRAVSDVASTERPWFSSEESTGISGLSAFRETHCQSTTVDTIDLQSFCVDNEIGEIEFLKIDTEGFDWMVLQGCDWSDEQPHPRLILCEFEDSKTLPLGYRWEEMAEFLTEKGFSVMVSEWKPIVRYGIAHQWRRFHHYPCTLVDTEGWGNLIAVRGPKDWKKLLSVCRYFEAQYHAAETGSQVSLFRRIVWKLQQMAWRY